MPTRIVAEHIAKTKENDELLIVTVYEEGTNKQAIKLMNRFDKKYMVLIYDSLSKRYGYKKA